ncbi:substrate-binding periplasmic protein [Oleisolibacter albus]|uniref:substrate-binding periplasmic protein n=1 Tax=Oleisolibacter albus TaxID=2171757 RepID=UPI0013902E8D|nr:transporter substrate-binding domain-containing protein [Oleisolibacter albus]
MSRPLFAACLALLPLPAAADPVRFIAGEQPPFAYTQDGIMRGEIADLAREVARRVGDGSGLTLIPWPRFNREAASDGPLLFVTVRRPERQAPLHWIGRLGQADLVLVSESAPAAISLDQARDQLVVVVTGSVAEQALQEAGFRRIEPVQTERRAAQLLSSGRVGIWATALETALSSYRALGLSADRLKPGAQILPAELWLAATPAVDAATVRRWSEAWNSMVVDGLVPAAVATGDSHGGSAAP